MRPRSVRLVVPCLAALTAVALLPGPARAELRIDPALGGAVTGVSLLGSAVVGLLPVDTERRWKQEPWAWEEKVKGNFSPAASTASDLCLLASVLSPVAARWGAEDGRGVGKAALVYGETLAGTAFLTSVVKQWVQRPRPYLYHPDPRVRQFAAAAGRDSRRSFFSGHASLSFAAAVSGSYIFGMGSGDTGARAAVWGVEMAFAAATAKLRVRAGMHFYSDVVAGALAGGLLGWAVPFLHESDPGRYAPEAAEWGAMFGGLAAGVMLSQWLPLQDRARDSPEAGVRAWVVRHGAWLAPVELEQGAGLLAGGRF